MNDDLIVGLAGSVLGGSLVSLITFLGSRGRIRAETEKLLAEAERTRAETTMLLAPPGIPIDDRRDVPPGWIVAGSRPADYKITLDRTVAHTGSASARLEAKPGARGFVTLMQEVRSTNLRGQRIRMTGWVKTEDVEDARFWMRVDGAEQEILAFDNMSERPITGTGDWCRHGVVLDVAATSRRVAFGIILATRGRLWVDNFSLEPVGDEIPTTDMVQGHLEYPGLFNLDFEE